MDSFAGKQNGPVTAFWHNGKLVEMGLAEALVVEAAADSEDVEVVEGVLARSTDVVGTATEMVVSWPEMVVSTNAAVGVDVVLAVPAIVSIYTLIAQSDWNLHTIARENPCQSRRGIEKHACCRKTVTIHC